MEIRDDIINKYKYILYNFFNQKRITDEDMRQDFLLKFYKLLENFSHLKNNSIEAYLRSSLVKILDRYWYDVFKSKKIDMKCYAKLNKEELKQWEIGLAIEKTFHTKDNGDIKIDEQLTREFVKLLSLRQQELIALIFYEGYTFKNASIRMGSTKQNISKMWNRIQYMFNNCIILDFGPDNNSKLMKIGKKNDKV